MVTFAWTMVNQCRWGKRGKKTDKQLREWMVRSPSVIDLVEYKPRSGGTKAMRNTAQWGAQWRGRRNQMREGGQKREAGRVGEQKKKQKEDSSFLRKHVCV